MEEIQLGAIGNDGSGDPLARQSAAINRNFAETVDATSPRTVTLVDDWSVYPNLNQLPSAGDYFPAILTVNYSAPDDPWIERMDVTGEGLAVYRWDGTDWTWNRLTIQANDLFLSLRSNTIIGAGYPSTYVNLIPPNAAGMSGAMAITVSEGALRSGQSTDSVLLRSLNGTTAERPALPNATRWPVGAQYFDTSLGSNGKPIWVNKAGTGWVDATGASV